MKTLHYFSFVLLLLQILPGALSVKYKATNAAPGTPGGSRFNAEIGIPYTLKIMKHINYFIWDIFQQRNVTDRKPVETATVVIYEYDGAEAITYGDTVNVSSLYLKGYQGNLKWEFTSLLYHELTHVFQWDGEGTAPIGLVEGMADYMILISNYYPTGFAKAGQGDRWDQGYDFTARFLQYCEKLKPGFVAKLNKMMRHKFSEDYFRVLTGKKVAQLWKEYKAKYAKSN